MCVWSHERKSGHLLCMWSTEMCRLVLASMPEVRTRPEHIASADFLWVGRVVHGCDDPVRLAPSRQTPPQQ